MDNLVEIVEDNKEELNSEIYKKLLEEIMDIKNKHKLKKEFYEFTLEFTEPTVYLDENDEHALNFDSRVRKIILPRSQIRYGYREYDDKSWTITEIKKYEGRIIKYQLFHENKLIWGTPPTEAEVEYLRFHKRTINGEEINILLDCGYNCECQGVRINYNGTRMLKVELISE